MNAAKPIPQERFHYRGFGYAGVCTLIDGADHFIIVAADETALQRVLKDLLPLDKFASEKFSKIAIIPRS
jgi:hypothetical protein